MAQIKSNQNNIQREEDKSLMGYKENESACGSVTTTEAVKVRRVQFQRLSDVY